jgi:ABC-2 type transport system ATP-binding protein
VIVIDQGKLIWDGSLQDLVRSMRPEKRIVLRLGATPTPADLAWIGARLRSHEGPLLKLQIPQAELQTVVPHLLASLSVVDLTIEDPPLEEVVADLFAGRSG